jgi:uroporphyrinogen-III synthase
MNNSLILITRPEPQATKTALQLQQMGYATITSPVIMQQPVDNAEILLQNALPQYDAYVLTSGYGLQILAKLPQLLLSQISSKPLYVTGDILANQAGQIGFTQVKYGNGTARSLLDYMQQHANKKLQHLYLHSNHQAVNMADILKGLGFRVKGLEIYQTMAVDALTIKAINALQHQQIKAVMLYSAMSARCFIDLAHQSGLAEELQYVEGWCISQNIANSLPKHFFKHIKIIDLHSLERNIID